MAEHDLSGTRVGVVGGGFGGLSAAAHLAAAGADVDLYERAGAVGGVAGRIETDGFRFDTGPSWYLMPEVFERFFAAFDRRPEECYELVRLDPHYRVFWTDGDRADVPADPEAAAALFESYEAGAGAAFRRYLDDAADAYEIGMERFVIPGRSRVRDYLSTDVVRAGRGLGLLGNLDDHVRSYVEHPKLRQLLEYTLVFLGGSPYNTPALYKLMSHVDFGLGVYYPQGGMRAVVEAVREVAVAQGARIHTNAAVTALTPVDDGMTATVDGEARRYDRVVANAPPAHVERDLLPDGAVRRRDGYWDERTYGPSAFLAYLGVEGDVEPLAHHTLVLPTDWDPHFAAIFDEPRWPADPAFYVNVPSLTDPAAAPAGCETVVVLVPIAPGLPDSPAHRARAAAQALDALARHAGVDLRDRLRVVETACVDDFAGRFARPGGTALGLAHTLRQTGPLRPGQRVPGCDRLYYVGGDANPGIGVPMCLLSGEHGAAAVAEDESSSDRLLPV